MKENYNIYKLIIIIIFNKSIYKYILNIFNFNFKNIKLFLKKYKNGDWGLGIGDWGLGIGPNPQSPIPNPQSPIPIFNYQFYF